MVKVVDALGTIQNTGPGYQLPEMAEYRVDTGDILDISYPLQPELSISATVAPDGTISVPFAPQVRVRGKTVEEIQAELKAEYASQVDGLPAPEARAYQIQTGDTLEVKFYEYYDLNDIVIVRPDGRVSLVLAPSIVAEGKTPEQLQAELTAIYARHVVDPKLAVIVRDFRSDQYVVDGQARRPPLPNLDAVTVSLNQVLPPRVFVGGEVFNPGALDYRRSLTALEAIMSAGGNQFSAQMDNVVILRKQFVNEEPVGQYIVIDLEADLKGEATNDILLKPFDVVVVPKTGIAEVTEFVDRYVYRLFPQLRNLSVGFTFTRQLAPDETRVLD